MCSPGVLSAMSPGSALVVHTTGSPRTVQAIAAHSPGIDVLDAPVSGGPHNIAAGAITLFVGGPDDAVARVRPVLAAYGDPILHVGPLGAGQAVKLTNNALFAAQIGLLAGGCRAGRSPRRERGRSFWRRSRTAAGRARSRASSRPAARWTRSSNGPVSSSARTSTVVRKIAAELGEALGLLDDVINAGNRP